MKYFPFAPRRKRERRKREKDREEEIAERKEKRAGALLTPKNRGENNESAANDNRLGRNRSAAD